MPISSNLQSVRNGCEVYGKIVETGYNVTKNVTKSTYQVGAGFVNSVANCIEVGVTQTAVETLKWTSGYTNFKDGVSSLFTANPVILQDEDDRITKTDKRTFPTKVGNMFGQFAVGGAKLWTAASYIQGVAINNGLASSNLTAEAVHAGINTLANATYSLATSLATTSAQTALSVAFHPIVSYKTTKTVAIVAGALTCSYLLAKTVVKTYDTTSYVATNVNNAMTALLAKTVVKTYDTTSYVATNVNNAMTAVEEKTMNAANQVLTEIFPVMN